MTARQIPVYYSTKDWPRLVANAVNTLVKDNATAGGTATWGSITGTLSGQTDLQAALDAKLVTTGATTLVTAGTLTTGTWNASTIAVSYGGTGATTLTSGYLLKGNGTSAVTASVAYDDGSGIGIGTTSPDSSLHVAGDYVTITNDSFTGVYCYVASSAAASTQPYHLYYRARGTIASPSQTQSGDYLGSFGFRGYESGGPYATSDSARITCIAQAAQTSSNHAADLRFYTVPAGSTTVTEGFRIATTGALLCLGNTFLDGNRLFRLRAYTVGTLPTAGTAGRRAYVTDATAPTYGATLTGSGAVVVPVFDDGTNWVSA